MGAILHALVGALIMASAVFGGAFGLLGAIVLYGIGREMTQHDFSLTLHQWVEALAWGAGAAVALWIGYYVLS